MCCHRYLRRSPFGNVFDLQDQTIARRSWITPSFTSSCSHHRQTQLLWSNKGLLWWHKSQSLPLYCKNLSLCLCVDANTHGRFQADAHASTKPNSVKSNARKRFDYAKSLSGFGQGLQASRDVYIVSCHSRHCGIHWQRHCSSPRRETRSPPILWTLETRQRALFRWTSFIAVLRGIAGAHSDARSRRKPGDVFRARRNETTALRDITVHSHAVALPLTTHLQENERARDARTRKTTACGKDRVEKHKTANSSRLPDERFVEYKTSARIRLWVELPSRNNTPRGLGKAMLDDFQRHRDAGAAEPRGQCGELLFGFKTMVYMCDMLIGEDWHFAAAAAFSTVFLFQTTNSRGSTADSVRNQEFWNSGRWNKSESCHGVRCFGTTSFLSICNTVKGILF